jgi:hypothetical protein
MRSISTLPTGLIWPLAFFFPGFAAMVLSYSTFGPVVKGVAAIAVGALSFGFAGKLWTDARLGPSDRSHTAALCWGVTFLSAATVSVMMAFTEAPHVLLLVGGAIIGTIGWFCQSRIEGRGIAGTLRGVAFPAIGFSFAGVLYVLIGYLFALMAFSLIGMLDPRFVPAPVQVIAGSAIAAGVAAAASGILARGSLDAANRIAGRNASGSSEIVHHANP